MIKSIIKFFDKLEDRIRAKLTHKPLLYAFIGSVGVVSIWRGVWVIEDSLFMSGFESLILGIFITVMTGLFVSFFIGDNIIISGLKKDKRIDEKTEEEIIKEKGILEEIQKELNNIKEEIKNLKKN
ncbi:TPA: hypothetical protein DIC38_02055 [Candidatus Nomurabacteria bacterium]|nr:MAG: hypothetical protein O210_OD1C00001G0320 [Parcubacteria bacterium RAAC4_OD1_1]HCY26440.1 hypothetical protein [Candidatus Nomurabacteria bacterium]